MSDEAIDVQKMILGELREIKSEVRHIPKLQAQVDSLSGATHQLETAMRETTAALQTQASAHSKIIDELRLQVHQSISSMMGISNDVQSLMTRVKDIEKQTAAAFQQQLQLAKDVREASGFPDPKEYQALKAEVDTLPTLRDDVKDLKILKTEVDTLPTLRDDVKDLKKHTPWLVGIEWFLRILFCAMAGAAVAGLLLLLGQSLIKAFS